MEQLSRMLRWRSLPCLRQAGGVDFSKYPEPLTPSHLVIGRRLLDKPTTSIESLRTMARREKYLQSFLTHLKNRWRTQYLTGIREYQKFKLAKPKRVIQVGDIVHIHADRTPKQQWRTGKVEKLLRGREDVVRAAEVVTVDNSLRQVRLKRPMRKLYPLEVNARDEDPVTVVGASIIVCTPEAETFRWSEMRIFQ